MKTSKRFVGMALSLLMLVQTTIAAQPPGSIKRDPATDKPPLICERIILGEEVGELLFRWGGREDEKLREFYKKYAIDIFGPEGAAHKLGWPLPPHEINYSPSHELTALATLGHHAVGHASEGLELLRRMFQTLGVYEFVWEGCPHCRSFSADVTDPYENLSILMHVLLHNVFSRTALTQVDRKADPIQASWKMAHILEQAEIKHDYDEVHRYYQQLLTLLTLQDFHRGTFEPPELLKPGTQPATERVVQDNSAHAVTPKFDPTHHPIRPTFSVIQFMSANQDSDRPEHKRELLSGYEEMVRAYPAVSHSKIMNEGLATFGMLQLGKYLLSSIPEKDEARLKWSRLIDGVAGSRGGFSNPYTLGLQGWLSMYRQIRKRPEMRGKDEVTIDQQFVKEALEMVRWMDDKDFLRATLDQDFVRDNRLELVRRVRQDEIDWSIPRERWEDNVQIETVTADWRRIVDHIAHKFGRKDLSTPLISANNNKAFGRNVFYMEQHHSVDRLPLDLTSVVQSLYQIAQVQERPVALKGTADFGKYFMPPALIAILQRYARVWHISVYELINDPRFKPMLEYLLASLKSKAIVMREFYMEVSAAGEVRLQITDATDFERGGRIEPVEGLITSNLQLILNDFIEDDAHSNSPELNEHLREKFQPMFDEIVQFNFTAPSGLISHAPTMGKAYEAYAKLLRKRLAAKMGLIKSGKITGRRTSRGVAVAVMPDAPHISYDRKAQQMILQDKTRPDMRINSRLTLDSGMPQVFLKNPQGQEKIDIEMTLSLQKAWMEAEQDRELEPLRKALESVVEMQNLAAATPDPAHWLNRPPSVDDEDLILRRGPGRERDRGWIPDPDGGGRGKPGGEPGEDSLDPSEVEIPLHLWGKILAEELELPNLKPKGGESDMTRTVRSRSIRKPAGRIVWSDSTPGLLRRGLALLQNEADENEDPEMVDPMDALFEGFATTPRGRLHKKATEEEKIPDIKAVVAITIDSSGSMMGWPIEQVKEFVFNLHALLSAKYKDIEFVFILFDGTAVVAKTLEEAMKMQKGGGTNYAAGFKATADELKKYNPAQWDRYSITAGDSGDFGSVEGALAEFKRVRDESEYAAYLHVDAFGPSGLSDAIQGMSKSEPYLGYAEMHDNPDSAFAAMRHLFGKRKAAAP